MISDATLHGIVGVLDAEAEHTEVAAHLAAEAGNRSYAEGRLARAARLRAYIAEIHAHLRHTPATPGDDGING